MAAYMTSCGSSTLEPESVAGLCAAVLAMPTTPP
jgi:hypothetical protein